MNYKHSHFGVFLVFFFSTRIGTGEKYPQKQKKTSRRHSDKKLKTQNNQK